MLCGLPKPTPMACWAAGNDDAEKPHAGYPLLPWGQKEADGQTELWPSAHAWRQSENQERQTRLRDPAVLTLQIQSPLWSALHLGCEASLSPCLIVGAFGNFLNDTALKRPIAATSGERPLPVPSPAQARFARVWFGQGLSFDVE